jgi:hypothetical protein
MKPKLRDDLELIKDIYYNLYGQRNSNGVLNRDSIIKYLDFFDYPEKEFIFNVICEIDQKFYKDSVKENGKRSKSKSRN